jgi:hypothetical protein
VLTTAPRRDRWPPRNRTAPYRLIRAAPSTSWVVASGGESGARTHKAVKLAGFRIRCRRPTLGLPLRSGWRRTRTCPRREPRPPVSSRAPCQLGQPSEAESGGHGPHALRRALVSTEARSLTGSLSSRTLPGTRTQTTRGLNALALPIGLEGPGVSDGARTRDLDAGNVARHLLRHAHTEPSDGLEPSPSPLPRARSTARATKARQTTGLEPPAGLEPATCSVQASCDCPRCAKEADNPATRACIPSRAACARRDSNPQHPASRAGLSANWSTSTSEPPDGLEPPSSPYESDALPDELQRPGCRAETRTPILGFRGHCPAN